MTNRWHNIEQNNKIEIVAAEIHSMAKYNIEQQKIITTKLVDKKAINHTKHI